MKMPLFRSAFAATIAAFAALVLAAAPAWAGSTPQCCLDECYGKQIAIHVKGWAYDPDVSSQSTAVQVYLYTDSNCTTLYDNPTLTANVPRHDVNQVKGIAGDHGFDADISVADAGDYWVKVVAVDATGDGNLQVGTTRSVTVAPRLPGSGTPADPYRISSAADWNIFASNISAGFDSNSCYRLGADIGSVTVPVGTAEHPFAGTFDGGSNTLTVALSGSDRAIAPFFRVSGATIRNLKVAGTVSGAIHCSGLVGEVVGGPNLIENCEVAAAITCSASHFGGFIGHSVTYAATLRGCVFSGSLSGGTYVATFHGWSDGGATTTLIDCLDASESDQPIGRGHDAACVSNTYYFATKNFNNEERLWSEGKRGKRAYAVTEGEGVTIDFGAPATTYGTTGITAYGVGMAYGGTFYAGEGDVVPLTLSATPPSGMILDAYVSSAGTLSVNGDAGTLTMPAANVAVNASWTSAGPTDLSTLTGGYTAADGEVLTGETAYTVMIPDGATVTLSNAVIEASDSPGIICLGDATIVLVGSNTVTGGYDAYDNCGRPGIQAGPANTTLEICGGGSLTAAGGKYAPAIGSCDGGECGDVVISSGTIVATGGDYAPAIGCSGESSCGDIMISGGTVTATGGYGAAGIGCCYESLCGDITITDGVTLLTSVNSGMGSNIGAGAYGSCGTVTVGGVEMGEIAVSPYVYRPSSVPFAVSFDSNGGNGSMAGQSFASGIPQNLSSNGFTRAGWLFYGWNTRADGHGTYYYDGQPATFGADTTLYAQWCGADVTLTPETGDITLVDGQVLVGTGGTNTHVVVVPGATVTLSNAVIEASDGPGITCLGDAVVVLEGINVARGSSEDDPGIQAGPDGTRLEIRGGGSLSAAGGEYAAGIGNGADGSCGDIVISGGTVTATGGFGAAGIGSGIEGACGDIVISGGTVTATGGDYAAGIGSGGGGECGAITIADGVFSVSATCGEWGLNPIGAGDGGTCGTVTVAPGLTDDTEGQTRWLDHSDSVTLTGESGEILLTDGQTLVGTGGENTHVLIADGATVMLRNCDLMEFAGEGANTPWAGITCLGDATIILEGNNVVRGFDLGYPGVFVPENKMLVIRGTGTLAAFAGSDLLDSAPGISGAVTIGGTAYPDGIADGIVLCCAIGTTEVWDKLASLYEPGNMPGIHACVWLTSDDVVVSNMMGNADLPFHGTFDGCGHTLTLNLGEDEGGGGGILRSAPPATSIPFTFVAPFSVVNDATIKNVKVGGEVRGVQFAAGLVGYVAGGTNRIENCVVEASFLDVWRCGGIVCAAGDVFDPESDPGRDGVSTTLAGCVFDGDIDPYCNIANTLVGVGCDVVVDCLDVSDSGWPMFTDEYDFVINNTYYTATNKVDIYVMEILGARATAKAERPSSIGGERTDYGFVKAYASGLEYGGMYYVVEGGVVAEGGTVVPDEWLAQYYPGQEDRYATIVNSTAANGRKVWACYVADLDPTDPDDDLVAGIDVSGGKVRVYILKGQSPNRYYSLFGYETLDAKPIILRNGLDFDYSGHSCRFFRIEVSLDPPVIGPK